MFNGEDAFRIISIMNQQSEEIRILRSNAEITEIRINNLEKKLDKLLKKHTEGDTK